ncbi:hypothetical protein VCHA29O37_160060 [Vibrio chagasii]|nr:hypothetical protein VCHA29O37_160060 [Vibrio chagasii]
MTMYSDVTTQSAVALAAKAIAAIDNSVLSLFIIVPCYKLVSQ